MDDESKRQKIAALKPLLTRSQWDAMLAAYREQPSESYVARATGIGMKTVKRAISLGFPEFNWPPFVQIFQAPSTVHKELAILQEDWSDAIAAKTESARQAAQEAMAARVSMASAMKCAQMTHTFVERVLEKMDAGDFDAPDEITPKVIYQLARALETTNSVLAKSMEIQNKRSGAPQNTLGTVVIDLLERCSDEELDGVINRGELPPRITGHKKVVDAESEVVPVGMVPPPPYAGPTDPLTVQQIIAQVKEESEKDLKNALVNPENPEDDIDAACVLDFSKDPSSDSENTEDDEDEDLI